MLGVGRGGIKTDTYVVVCIGVSEAWGQPGCETHNQGGEVIWTEDGG